jgi:branched-chain amino acid transport system ATP-binding protein
LVEEVSKDFGGLQALKGITLELRAGERRAIIGPNGAGKTTLFNLITGVVAPSSGEIYLFGEQVTGMPVHRRAAMGVARTFQITTLFPTLTVEENLLLGLQAQKTCRFVLHRPISSFDHLLSSAQEILDTWGFWERRNTELRNLSYGEQREMEIVMALAQEPKLLLLDEPTSGLAPAETARVCTMISSLPGEITVLLIEHDMDVTFDLAERISVLHLGELVAEGTPEEVRQDTNIQQIYLGTQAS